MLTQNNNQMFIKRERERERERGGGGGVMDTYLLVNLSVHSYVSQLVVEM